MPLASKEALQVLVNSETAVEIFEKKDVFFNAVEICLFDKNTIKIRLNKIKFKGLS